MKTYITYGKGDSLDFLKLPKKPNLKIEKNDLHFKIHGALWGSPENSKYGFRHWYKNEMEHIAGPLEGYFKWTLRNDTKILFISSFDDIETLPKSNGIQPFDYNWVLDNYDAVEIGMNITWLSENAFLNGRPNAFWGWDCESIMVMNGDMVISV